MNEQHTLPEYTEAELEQHAINNMRDVIVNFESMVEQEFSAERIVGLIQDAKYRGYKTLRYPREKKAEPWRVNEIGVA